MTGRRYFEDFAIGQKFASAPQTVDAAAIKAFAAQLDRQPFHLDEEAARHSLFGGLLASAWHSAAVGARLF
jgi:acyl dehydratase